MDMERNLTEQAAYIKGLAEGLELDAASKEGKVISALLELTEALAKELANVRKDIEEIDDDLEYLNDYVEELDDDLESVESFISGEDDEDEDADDEDEEEDDLFDDGECDGNCEGCHGCDGEEYYEIVCPSCGETVCFDQELDPENLVCPACGEKFGCIVDEDDYKKLSDKDEKEND